MFTYIYWLARSLAGVWDLADPALVALNPVLHQGIGLGCKCAIAILLYACMHAHAQQMVISGVYKYKSGNQKCEEVQEKKEKKMID